MTLLAISAAFAQGMPGLRTGTDPEGATHMWWAYAVTAIVYLGYTAFLVVRGHQEKV